MTHIQIEVRDPLIARDSRPFAAGGGNRMRPSEWLLPTVVAGSLRTLLGKTVDPSFPPDLVKRLKQITVHGPLLERDGTPYFPAARDAVFAERGGRVVKARPDGIRDGEGLDFPAGGALRPVMLPDTEASDFKPDKPPRFWRLDRMTEWLLEQPLTLPSPQQSFEDLGYVDGGNSDERWHVAIDDARNAAKDEHLFLTSGLAFEDGFRLAVRFEGGGDWQFRPQWHPLGGERRLAHWGTGAKQPWECPAEIEEAVSKSRRIRMVLATPALFANGWLPEWLSKGKLPGSETKVRLVGVCGERWRAVSGFSLEQRRRGFKPIRRMVPAGNVYFFEVQGNGCLDVKNLWLRPVGEKVGDFHPGEADGFGLALWGVW